MNRIVQGVIGQFSGRAYKTVYTVITIQPTHTISHLAVFIGGINNREHNDVKNQGKTSAWKWFYIEGASADISRNVNWKPLNSDCSPVTMYLYFRLAALSDKEHHLSIDTFHVAPEDIRARLHFLAVIRISSQDTSFHYEILKLRLQSLFLMWTIVTTFTLLQQAVRA